MIPFFSNLVAGWLVSLSFAPSHWWISAAVGLAIWHRTIRSVTLFKAMLRSFCFFFALALSTIWWTGIYVGVLAPLAIALYQSLLFSVIPLLIKLSRNNSAFTYAGALVLFEWLIRAWPFGGFGWIRFGFTQLNSPLADVLPFLGVAGVSFVLALISFGLKFRSFIFVVILLMLVNILPTGAKTDSNQTLKVALIQGGVSKLGLDFNANPTEVFQRHLNQTKETIVDGEVDLIIWPENSVDVDLTSNPKLSAQISDLSAKLNTPILIGEVANASTNQNPSILFNPGPQIIYNKRYLTPFGEFIPMRSFFGNFSSYSDNVIDFEPGKNPVLFNVKNFSLNTKICYELLSDSQNREIADFSIVQSNNATFGYTKQLEQQLVIAKIRAIESGRYFAYVSTTGITSVINPSGGVAQLVPKFKSQTLTYEIPKTSGETINQRLGWIFEPVILILMLLNSLRSRVIFGKYSRKRLGLESK
jgi:apolipoprotein N-acyltransferase